MKFLKKKVCATYKVLILLYAINICGFLCAFLKDLEIQAETGWNTCVEPMIIHPNYV